MKTPMRELEEWIRSNIGDARKQRNEWHTQKDYYDGMLFAYGQMLNSIYTGLLQKEKELIARAFLDGYEQSYYPTTEFYPHKAEKYYNDTFTK